MPRHYRAVLLAIVVPFMVLAVILVVIAMQAPEDPLVRSLRDAAEEIRRHTPRP